MYNSNFNLGELRSAIQVKTALRQAENRSLHQILGDLDDFDEDLNDTSRNESTISSQAPTESISIDKEVKPGSVIECSNDGNTYFAIVLDNQARLDQNTNQILIRRLNSAQVSRLRQENKDLVTEKVIQNPELKVVAKKINLLDKKFVRKLSLSHGMGLIDKIAIKTYFDGSIASAQTIGALLLVLWLGVLSTLVIFLLIKGV